MRALRGVGDVGSGSTSRRGVGGGERALVGAGDHLEHRPTGEDRSVQQREVDLLGVHRDVLDVDRRELETRPARSGSRPARGVSQAAEIGDSPARSWALTSAS